MTAQEYLEQVKIQDKKVKMMRTKLAMLREALGIKGVSYECDGSVSGSHSTDKMAEAIAKIVDYEKDVKEAEANLTVLRYDAEVAIKQLIDETEQEVLERWYLLFQPMKQIASEMGYCRSSIYDYHRKALENLEDLKTSD
jgi:DNA-directed RNA polymerase specialized sigma subunit